MIQLQTSFIRIRLTKIIFNIVLDVNNQEKPIFRRNATPSHPLPTQSRLRNRSSTNRKEIHPPRLGRRQQPPHQEGTSQNHQIICQK